MPQHEAGAGAAHHGTAPMRGNRVSGGLRPRRGAIRRRDHQHAEGKWPDAQFSAYQRIVEQSDMVLAVHDLSASADRAEGRALRYALEALKKPALVLHPQTLTVQVFPQNSEKSHG